MSAQAGPFNGTKIKSGEERRFREGAASVGANSIRGGMFMKRLPSGTFLEPRKPRGGSSSRMHPWKLKKVSNGKYSVHEGTIGGVTASAASITLGTSANVYWKITVSPLVRNDGTAEDPFYIINGEEVTEVEITTSFSADDPALVDRLFGTTSNGVYYVHFATVSGGKIVYNRRFNMGVGLRDKDSGEALVGEGMLSIWCAGSNLYDFSGENTVPTTMPYPPCCQGRECVNVPYIESEVSGNYGVDGNGDSYDEGSGTYTGPGGEAQYAYEVGEEHDVWDAINYRWRICIPERGCAGVLTVTTYVITDGVSDVAEEMEVRVRRSDPVGCGEWSVIEGNTLPLPSLSLGESSFVTSSVSAEWTPDP